MPKTGSRFALIASLVITGAVLLYYRMLWPTFHEFVIAIDISDIPFSDFVVYFYEMGREVFVARTPIPGYHYSPFFAIILGAFGQTPLQTATALWVLLLVTTTFLFVILSFKIVYGSDYRFFPLFVALVLTSFPHLHNFKWGQVGVLVAVLILGALYSFLKGKQIAPGILVASAISLKYYPVVFAIPFLMTRNIKLISAIVIACTVLLFGIPVVLLGFQETLAFADKLLRGAYAKQIWAGGPNSQNLVNVTMRWLNAAGFESQMLRSVLRTLSYLMTETTIVLIFLMHRFSIARRSIWAFTLLFLCIPLLVGTAWPHYLVYFPFCQLFLFREITDDQTFSARHRRFLYLLLFLSVLLASVFAFNVADTWERYTGSGLLFLSNALMLGLSYWLVLPPLVRKFSLSNHQS